MTSSVESRPGTNLSRRAALLGLASLSGLAVVRAGTQESAPGGSPGGSLVWRDMDQKALNDAYSQFIYAPNINQVIDRWASNSALVLQRIGNPQRFAYGRGEVEGLDVFRTETPDAPIHVFIHGGAWQQGTAASYAFPAEMFVNAGVHYVVPDFSWIQDVGDSLYPIVDQLKRAIGWIYENASRFGGDRNRIHLSGHSSGGHLAGVLLTTDWVNEMNLPADVIKSGLCCSGMYDMEPVRLSSRGDYIEFTDAMEHDMSPQRHLEHLRAPLVVVYGSYETPEFKRQSVDFVRAAQAVGKPVELVLAEDYNHFEVLETLANPYGVLGRIALDHAVAGVEVSG